MGRLFTNFVGPHGSNGPLGLDVTQGTAFTVPGPGVIDELSWYRQIAGSNGAASNMKLWAAGNAIPLATVGSPTDSGVQGWQRSLITPVSVSPGITYIVSSFWLTGKTHAQDAIGSAPTPEDSMAFGSPAHYLIGGDALPTNTSGTTLIPNDVRYTPEDDIPPPEEPATAGQVNALLASWLHTTANDHPTTSTPYLTHLLATAIDAAVAETKDMVEALVAIGIGVKLGDAQAALDGLEAFLYSVAPDDLKSYLDGLGSGIRGTGSPTIADAIDAVNALPTGGGGLPAGPVSVANGWTLRETIPGVGKIKTDEPADAYILVRTGWDADRAVNIYEGVTYFFDRGWWAPQQEDVIEGYGTLAAQTHLLRVPTGRMSGVLIVQDDDFEFDLQVWDAPAS